LNILFQLTQTHFEFQCKYKFTMSWSIYNQDYCSFNKNSHNINFYHKGMKTLRKKFKKINLCDLVPSW